MVSTARFIVLVSLSSICTLRTARADKCDSPSAAPPRDQRWLYVRLVDAKTSAVIDGAIGRVTNEIFKLVKPIKSCFVPAVSKTATDVTLHANAFGYVGKLCRPGNDWTSHCKPSAPYDCHLVPKPGSMADAGVTKLGDLKDERARKDAIAEAVDFSMQFEPGERVEVLQRLSERIDVRSGLLAQELLNRQQSIRCTGSACVDSLPVELDKVIRDYLVTNKEAIAGEELRVKQKLAITVSVKDPKLKDPLIVLVDDPSRDASFGIATAELKKHIKTRFPEKAYEMTIFVDAKFDPGVTLQKYIANTAKIP